MSTGMMCPNCGRFAVGTTHACFPPTPTPKPPNLQGWVCPKCGRVYSPITLDCRACNLLIEAARVSPGKENE